MPFTHIVLLPISIKIDTYYCTRCNNARLVLRGEVLTYIREEGEGELRFCICANEKREERERERERKREREKEQA